MKIAQFLDCAQHREGKYELVRGEVFAMGPEIFIMRAQSWQR
jgi:hypothetical protein